jgi:hypothetical protein
MFLVNILTINSYLFRINFFAWISFYPSKRVRLGILEIKRVKCFVFLIGFWEGKSQKILTLMRQEFIKDTS